MVGKAIPSPLTYHRSQWLRYTVAIYAETKRVHKQLSEIHRLEGQIKYCFITKVRRPLLCANSTTNIEAKINNLYRGNSNHWCKVSHKYLLLGLYHSVDSAIDLHGSHPHAQALSCEGYPTHKLRLEVWLSTILTNPLQHCKRDSR